MKAIRVLAVFACFLLCLLTPTVVSATDHPDSVSIDDVYANRHLIETDDLLIYATYNIAYTTVPDDGIDDTFIFRLIDTDGTTELGSFRAYPYQNSGYGKGLISFYFSAATAPTWGSNYYIRISENPNAFDDPDYDDFIVPSSAYSSQTTQNGNRDELESNILAVARDLDAVWGSSYDLLDETDTGTVLSDQGEAYFREAVPGLQSMVPDLFLTKIEDPDYTERTWNTSQNTTWEQRTSSERVGSHIQGFADLFSVDFNLIAGLPLLAGMVMCVIASVVMSNRALPGLMCCIAIAIVGWSLGWAPGAMIAAGSLICVLYMAGMLIKRFIPGVN